MNETKDKYIAWLKEQETLLCTPTPVINHVKELEYEISEVGRYNLGLADEIRKLEKNVTELIGALSIALDDKRRKLYIDNLKETLNKYKGEYFE